MAINKTSGGRPAPEPPQAPPVLGSPKSKTKGPLNGRPRGPPLQTAPSKQPSDARPSRALPICAEGALLCRPKVACLMLNCSLTTLLRLIRDGEIESFKQGYIRRIVVSSVHAYIERMLKAPDPLRERSPAATPPAADAAKRKRRPRTNNQTIRGAEA